MDLHRTKDNRPDWEHIPANKWNRWQKIAAKTNGVVTPGNVVTVAGGALVCSGLIDIQRGHKTRGILKMGVGRMADKVDGFVAEKTGTKSPRGEALDAIFDKVLLALALPVLVRNEIVPLRAAAHFALQNSVNAYTTAVAKKQNTEIHASAVGKITSAAQWGTIGFYSFEAMADDQGFVEVANGFHAEGLVAETVTAGLGAVASIGYARVTATTSSPPN